MLKCLFVWCFVIEFSCNTSLTKYTALKASRFSLAEQLCQLAERNCCDNFSTFLTHFPITHYPHIYFFSLAWLWLISLAVLLVALPCPCACTHTRRLRQMLVTWLRDSPLSLADCKKKKKKGRKSENKSVTQRNRTKIEIQGYGGCKGCPEISFWSLESLLIISHFASLLSFQLFRPGCLVDFYCQMLLQPSCSDL